MLWSLPSLKSPDIGCSLGERIKILVHHFREEIGGTLAAPRAFSHLSSPVIPALPFSSMGIHALTDGPGTSGHRRGEGDESAEKGVEEGEEGGPG